MKLYKCFLSLIFASLLLFSCQKVELNRINKITTDKVMINNTSVEIKGTIIDVGADGILKYGHCYSTNPIPTIANTKTVYENAVSETIFTSNLTNLSANTTYYICSYAQNNNETIYGEIKSFNLSALNTISVVASNLQIQSETSFTLDGAVSELGSLTAIDYGHCWATHSLPTVSDNFNINGDLSSNVAFSSTINNLALETNYYVRAYLKLDNNTFIYSNELSTLIPDLNVVTDTFAISTSTAILGGTIVNLGVLPVIDHGHCWSTTTSNPNFNDNVISLGTATTTGTFYNNLNLVNGTTYYYRAYARKGTTIKYGSVKSVSF